MTYQTIPLDKSLYKAYGSLSRALEQLDPSGAYAGTELAGLDAFGRQLKRFGIKVSGERSDLIEKFFKTSDSAALFPEYVALAVRQGAQGRDILSEIIAAKTAIDGMDYRTIATDADEGGEMLEVAEGAFLPHTTIKLRDNLVKLVKRGRLLAASYEAIRFQRIDLMSVALRQIGAAIAKSQLRDAVEVLIGGEEPAQELETGTKDTIGYADLVRLWNSFTDYEMNVLLAPGDVIAKLMLIEQMQDAAAGLSFHGTGKLITPMGAVLIKCDCVPAGKLVALDKNFALEMVTAGEMMVEYDKLIDCQLERSAITSLCGFSKIFPEAVKVLKIKTA